MLVAASLVGNSRGSGSRPPRGPVTTVLLPPGAPIKAAVMGGGSAPSPTCQAGAASNPIRGLDLTAAYIAEHSELSGSVPGRRHGAGISGTPSRLAGSTWRASGSHGAPAARGREKIRFDRPGIPPGAIPDQPITGPAVLVGGRLDADAVGRMALRDKLVVYVTDFAAPPSDVSIQVARAIRLAAPTAVLLVANLAPADFTARVPRTIAPRTTVDLKLVSPPTRSH